MKRFRKSHADKYGNIYIYDTLNTEPVCMILGAWHPDKVDIILDALEKSFGGVTTDTCECGNDKAEEWLHCGCK